MEDPARRATDEDAAQEPNGAEGRGSAGDSPVNRSVADEDPTEVLAEEGPPGNGEETGADAGEFRRRIEAKDRHIRELYEELAAARLAADEARARMEAGELRVRDLEDERAWLKERLREFEEEERTRRRRREGQDRRAERLEREIERREADIERLQALLEERTSEMDAHDLEAQETAYRKDTALEDALRRVEGLERDLEEREEEISELEATIDELQTELELEYELRRRMADPANRLRSGIGLFNDSDHLQAVISMSKSLGKPEVHVIIREEEGDEPPVILTFTWGGVTQRTYVANPGLAVKEPRVYLESAEEDLSGVEHEPSNSHIGADRRVHLGL